MLQRDVLRRGQSGEVDFLVPLNEQAVIVAQPVDRRFVQCNGKLIQRFDQNLFEISYPFAPFL